MPIAIQQVTANEVSYLAVALRFNVIHEGEEVYHQLQAKKIRLPFKLAWYKEKETGNRIVTIIAHEGDSTYQQFIPILELLEEILSSYSLYTPIELAPDVVISVM